jgi:RecQ-mediated genome instability protein 1
MSSLCGLRLGLLLRPDWLESYAEGIPGFDGIGGAEAQARRCFKQFLLADMNSCSPAGPGYMLSSLMSPSCFKFDIA